MATNYFKAIHHHQHRRNHSLWRRDSMDSLPPTSIRSFFLKPTNNHSLITNKTTIPHSVSSTSTPASTSQITTFDLLHQHLSAQNFRQADEETRRLLILLAGEQAQKRGYVFFSEVKFISIDELKAIDELWKKHSNSRFGYSVQKKIWNKVGRDFTKMFVLIGWMKKLETEVVQYGYRAFPEEFIWEINDGENNNSPPQGHLPLTNALRGTQLFTAILTHPAFGGDDGDSEIDGDDDIDTDNAATGGGSGVVVREPLTNKVFKADYTF